MAKQRLPKSMPNPHQRSPQSKLLVAETQSPLKMDLQSPESIMELQQTIGNQAVMRLIQREAAPSAQNEQMQKDAKTLQEGNATTVGVRVPITPDMLEAFNPDNASGSGKKPGLPDDHSYKYNEIKGDAFVKGAGDANEVDPNDVQQMGLADCYLLSALIAIARANPKVIRDMVSGPNDDGTFNVTLYVDKGMLWWKEKTPKVYKVSPTFPTHGDGKTPAYAQKGDIKSDGTPELWAMLIEKAYAIHEGGFDEAAWGFSADAMETLTGKDTVKIDMDDSEDDIAKKVDAMLNGGFALTASSKPLDSGDSKKKSKTLNIVGKHVYAVRGVDKAAKTIDLQNPWGSQDLPTLKISDLKAYFKYIDAVKVKK